jgi:hypothetical protein
LEAIFFLLSAVHRLRHDYPEAGVFKDFLAGKFRGEMMAFPLLLGPGARALPFADAEFLAEAKERA